MFKVLGTKAVSVFGLVLAVAIYRFYYYNYFNPSYGNDIPLVETKEATKLRQNVDTIFPPTPVIKTVIEHKIYVAVGFALGNIIMVEGDT